MAYGNSGGPLLNKNDKVIGMMFVKDEKFDEVSYALPINFVIDIVEKLENNELNRPNLGAIIEYYRAGNYNTVDVQL